MGPPPVPFPSWLRHPGSVLVGLVAAAAVGAILASMPSGGSGITGSPDQPSVRSAPGTMPNPPAGSPLSATAGEGARRLPAEPVATFSIVARDPENGDLGIAVQSKFFAVGRVVPYAAAGVGAVATQSYANTTYGPRGLEMLRLGETPEAVVRTLTSEDSQRDQRQVGIVDARGRSASFTGDANLGWAGSRTGPGYAVQGNILAGPEVVDAMADAFEQAAGDLATRLVAALAAGQAAGGDARGQQSAALLVVREGGGYGGFDDRFIDLRVDDDDAPIDELKRLLDIRHGQLAFDRARALLAGAGGGPSASTQEALREATAATTLNPADGWAWMTLAEIYVARGDLDNGAAAGRRALEADPWIKTAILGGIAGSTRVIEALLDDAAFRELWERIEAR